MDDHADDQDLEKSRALSKLDWPTAEMLAAARCARAKGLKEMVGEGIRRLKTVLAGRRHGARPAALGLQRQR
jgi:hypothetical protein